MNINKRWLLIVLVAFSQLALLLAANYLTFGWFASEAGSTLVNNEANPELIEQTQAMVMAARSKAFFITLGIGLVGIGVTIGLLSHYWNGVLATNCRLEDVAIQKTKEVLQTRNAVIFGLAKLAESRDTDTGEHLDRIRNYVTLLANDLSDHIPDINEDIDFIQNLELASSLHDIGKVGIPDSILLKPGRLTSEEREIMEIHTVIGGECLDAIGSRLGENEFMEMASSVAYSHHERWDGTGYPHGLKEDRIPLAARIVAVADVYDALTSKRPYKDPMTHEESRAIIVSGSGTQFDPEVVSAFLRNEEEFRAISIKQKFVSDAQAVSSFQKLAAAVEAQKAQEVII